MKINPIKKYEPVFTKNVPSQTDTDEDEKVLHKKQPKPTPAPNTYKAIDYFA